MRLRTQISRSAVCQQGITTAYDVTTTNDKPAKSTVFIRALFEFLLDLVHGSVCTSTDSTAGRSRTIGAQLSPASAEAYTCPPLVPKYRPHLSSESTAMASRN